MVADIDLEVIEQYISWQANWKLKDNFQYHAPTKCQFRNEI